MKYSSPTTGRDGTQFRLSKTMLLDGNFDLNTEYKKAKTNDWLPVPGMLDQFHELTGKTSIMGIDLETFKPKGKESRIFNYLVAIQIPILIYLTWTSLNAS